jgi:hypothetical protein
MHTVCGTATEPSMIRDAPCSRNVYLSHHCDPLSIQGLEIGTPPLKPPLDLMEKESVTATRDRDAPILPTKVDLMANVSWSQTSSGSVHQALGRGPAIAGVPRSQHINLALPG